MKERKMKKILAAILAVGMIAGVASADTSTNVLSRNAVGYVKVEVGGGEIALLRNNFNTLDGSTATPSSVYGDTLPLGTQIFYFNRETLNYDISTFEEGLDPVTFLPVQQWSDDTLDLSPGNSWWVRPSGLDPVDVIAMGEVPAVGSIDISVVPGLVMVSYPYPATINWVETELAQSAVLGDQVFFFDRDTGNYVTSTFEEGLDPVTFLPVQKWSQEDIVVEPGVGFWYKAADGRTIAESRPYSWPAE
jgi:hypothetical protein